MDEDYKARLAEIYRENYSRYIRYAERMLLAHTGSTDQAEDLVHQAFLRAVEKEEQSKNHPEEWIRVTIKLYCQNYFKKYGKAKTALKEKQIQLDETMAEIEYLESVYSFAETAGSVEEVDLLRAELIEGGYLRYRKSRDGSKGNRSGKGGKNRAAKPKPHTYTLPSGKTVLVGRNNKENDFLTFKRASSSDIWLHTKDIPGSHTILLTEGESPTEEDFRIAAQIAAFHSKGRSSANVPVDYTKVRYVKKPSGAKPGFVIFTHNRTLYVDPVVPE